jgi:undecaprenyl diphosphate synthase
MHIAIIMDGNGRWALQRGLPRHEGHHAGADTVDRIVEAAVRNGVGTLTLYAFSADNWRRPEEEVRGLLKLLRRYLLSQTRRCIENSIRLNVIGRRDRLDPSLIRAIESSESLTAQCSGMHLRLAVDYSSQQSLMAVAAAALHTATLGADRETFLRALAQVNHSTPAAAEVDLLIRTGGEQRLSDFLLFELAYAELYFSDRLWPDFSEQDFRLALSAFAKRERRFGRVRSHDAEVAGRV